MDGTGATNPSSPPPLICVSEECAGTKVSLAVFDLGRQLLVWGWAGAGGGGRPPPLGAVALGVPGPPRPTATGLVPGAGDDGASRALAARLATRLGVPVAVAWHIGGGGGGGGAAGPDAALGAWAERRLMEEMRKAGRWPAPAQPAPQ